MSDQYNHNGICANINPSDYGDLKRTCYDLFYNMCFNKIEYDMNRYCIKCLWNFCEKYNDQILNEIENGNDNVMTFYGYVNHQHNNLDNTDKYLLMAIEKENVHALYFLGRKYLDDDNIQLAKKYLHRAIDKKCAHAMCELGDYYFDHDIEQSLKYHLMASDNGHARSMYTVGYHYQYEEPNYDLMKKYYLMSIRHGCEYALENIYWYDDDKEPVIDTIELYFITNDKKLLSRYASQKQIDKLNKFIDQEEICMCESCYVETNCYPKNVRYFCKECYLQ